MSAALTAFIARILHEGCVAHYSAMEVGAATWKSALAARIVFSPERVKRITILRHLLTWLNVPCLSSVSLPCPEHSDLTGREGF